MNGWKTELILEHRHLLPTPSPSAISNPLPNQLSVHFSLVVTRVLQTCEPVDRHVVPRTHHVSVSYLLGLLPHPAFFGACFFLYEAPGTRLFPFPCSLSLPIASDFFLMAWFFWGSRDGWRLPFAPRMSGWPVIYDFASHVVR
jgi:hypothetical protein